MITVSKRFARNQYTDKFWSFKFVGLPLLRDVADLLSAVYSLHIFRIDHRKTHKKKRMSFQLAAPLAIYQVDYEKYHCWLENGP